jgi:hypothetical protein
VRENSFSDSLVEPSTEESSPGGASANSPALQRREKWKKWASPRGTTEVLTHTLQRWGEWKETFKSRRDDRVLALSVRLQLHAFSQTARKRLAFMRLNRRFAQPESPCPNNQSEFPLRETAKCRMDAGDLATGRRPLHNFRVTRLCTSCTRLRNKKLQMHELC